MRDTNLREHMDMPDPEFPMKVLRIESSDKNLTVNSHWHEHMEILLFKRGKMRIQCNKNSFYAEKGSLVLVNCNDIHTFENMCSDLSLECIIIDMSLLKSSFIDSTQAKFINPVINNNIIFKNDLTGDRIITKCFENIIKEYNQKNFGYELAIKAGLFEFISHLVRNHIDRMLTPQECDMRAKTLQRFKAVFEYVEDNYYENITVKDISGVANLSPYYFCRLFKETTGRSFVDYLNSFRINKAEQILRETDMNITETALACGFNDINYFSRMFKRYKQMPPSKIRKK
ncbi:MAG TPA: AraC family transcriptional regulator [Clostridiaceae bacterium]|nr:AraC family transcriptional regulator [Clostridiaceae bacterium]